MKIIKTIAEMKEWRRSVDGKRVGFVPTMGYLHEGHISLVRRAVVDNDVVAVSIFVNPTQFGPKEDFEKYPRDFDSDFKLLEKSGTDVVFLPELTEIYPKGYDTWVVQENITKRLEGEVRPTHFRGVTTVVCKLFNIVEPSKAYFGQKDAQQCLVIRRMVIDLNMNVELRIHPTVREKDGLAMSSRNTYLTPRFRKAAPVLFQSLKMAQEMYDAEEKDANKIRAAMRELVEKQPLGKIDYISIADTETLEEIDTIKGAALVSLAVKFGTTRLIDNTILG